MGSFRRYRDIAIVVLLLAVPFFFLRASIRKPEDMNVVDRTLMRVAAPVQYIAAAIARGVSSLVGDYVYLVDVLQRVETHPASQVEHLTPRLWKEHFAANPLRSDLDRLVKNAAA